MVALYIILGIAAIITVLLLLSVRIRLIYGEDFNIVIGYLFFNFSVVKNDEKINPSDFGIKKYRKRRLKEEKKLKKKQEKQLKSEKKPKEEKKKSFKENFDFFLKLTKDVLVPTLKQIGKSLKKVYIKKLTISVSADEPDKTAIVFGAVSQAASYLLELLNNAKKVKTDDISVYPDFTKTKCNFDVDITVYFPLYALVKIGISSLIRFLKLK